MSDWRKVYRAIARAALDDESRFDGFTRLTINAKSIDADSLPALAVGTPRETSARDGLETTERQTTLVVVIKRMGGDSEALEDTADDDAAAVEVALGAAFDDAGIQWTLTEYRYDEDAGGRQTVSTAAMQFALVTWPDDPLTLS